jgi:hypothetical protein
MFSEIFGLFKNAIKNYVELSKIRSEERERLNKVDFERREKERAIEIARIKEHFEETSDLGKAGEYYTYNVLKCIFPENRIFRNVYIKNYYGTYSEIDLLAFTNQSVFVFESKNYSGWIFGSEPDKYWTQSFKGGKKFKFINPISQNKVHMNTLRHNLQKIPQFEYHSIIVFSKRCELKKISYSTQNTYVINRNRLFELLVKIIDKENRCFLSEEQSERIVKFFSEHQRPGDNIKNEHLDQISKHHYTTIPKY